jgi:1,3-beta-glucan synthase
MLFVLFLALIVGPIVAGPRVTFPTITGTIQTLIQPNNMNNNDTISSQTGTFLDAVTGVASSTAAAASSTGN